MVYALTTGEQTVSSTGPITGTLGTSTLYALDWEVSVRVRNLAAGKRMSLILEASANGTFSDAVVAARFEFAGSGAPEGDTESALGRNMQLVPFGGIGNALRLNVAALDSGASASVLGTLVQ